MYVGSGELISIPFGDAFLLISLDGAIPGWKIVQRLVLQKVTTHPKSNFQKSFTEYLPHRFSSRIVFYKLVFKIYFSASPTAKTKL